MGQTFEKTPALVIYTRRAVIRLSTPILNRKLKVSVDVLMSVVVARLPPINSKHIFLFPSHTRLLSIVSIQVGGSKTGRPS